MTEEQNKQTGSTSAGGSGNRPQTNAAQPSAAAKHEPARAKKPRSAPKAPDMPGTNANEGKKPLGQYVREQRRLRLFAMISVLALLAAVAALSAAYWLWQQGLHQHQQQAQLHTQLQQRIADLQQQQQQIRQNIQTQHNALQQSLSRQLDEQLGKLEQQQETVVEPDWLLAEAEYLVRVADQRLQLVGDVDTAVNALMLADQRLFALRDPRVTAARRQLNNDINRLRSLPRIDTVGIALTLSSLQQQVSTLPVNLAGSGHTTAGGRATPAETDNKAGLLDSIIATLKGLVSIRRVDDKATAVVPPEQRGFLFQNLALKLEGARFALLSGDDTLFHQSLDAVQTWLNDYFDQQASAVQAMQAAIQKAAEVNLNPQLPDLSASLQALQAVISERRTAAEQGGKSTTDGMTAVPANSDSKGGSAAGDSSQ